MALVLQSWASAWAAPKAEPWPKWEAQDAASTATIDHSPWQQILDRYLSASGDPQATRFDYGAVSSQDKSLLEGYLSTLQNTRILTYNRAEQFAYWINLYNAATVNLILDHYPVESIRDIKFGFFSFGPWNEKLLKVEGESLSLNDIEHRILRPIWKDNRIHYAVNCASIGCPNLALKAYTADNTQSLLQQGAVDYVNHPRGVAISGKELQLSSIYDWYQSDFGGNEEGVIEHLLKYAKPELGRRLSGHDLDVDYHYDWGLNTP
ncbi:DUF547 domain-containing protein [Ketobacter sp.]|uniref:DUF547 domain-containing protein n=1 Tax=Ketobacter sp. TaxID=2083498 RepID=UPI000F0E85B8|nr:DUF547 domain-containing protein [Ketobacter sp.]RLT99317.1 MAG: DUF547 domain-containing protein [Ketobacter sp.]